MIFQKLINAIILLFIFSNVKGQVIHPKDLIGLWDLEVNKYDMPIEFFDSLKFKIIPDPTQIFWSRGHYNLKREKETNVLVLSIDSFAFSWTRKIYIIQKMIDFLFMLQIPKKTVNGEIIYQWNKTDKSNTFYMSKMESKKTTVN